MYEQTTQIEERARAWDTLNEHQSQILRGRDDRRRALVEVSRSRSLSPTHAYMSSSGGGGGGGGDSSGLYSESSRSSAEPEFVDVYVKKPKSSKLKKSSQRQQQQQPR